MKRSKDWAVVELRKGLAGDKCSMCLTDLSRQAMIFKSTNPQGKKVRLEYRCWRCVRSAEGAYLFVTAFPGVFETYRDQHGVHLRPSKVLVNSGMVGVQRRAPSSKHIDRLLRKKRGLK